MNSLYPLKFEPILKPVIWGGNRICKYKKIKTDLNGIGESWEISAVPNNVSVIANGEFAGCKLDELIRKYGASLVGNENIARFGNTFPLLIKFIDAADDLSIQVHPSDELAERRHKSKGKTEMWYVLDADDGATLYAGFNRQITPEEYVERVKNNTITEVLDLHPVKKGDVFFLPAGAVHAIRKGTFIAEIQQSSDITYRIYDYNRKDKNGNARELHTELAKDAIDYTYPSEHHVKYTENKNLPNDIVSCPYFSTGLIYLDEPMFFDYSDLDSFVVYICIEGACRVESMDGKITPLAAGETLLLPACTDCVTVIPENSGVKILETYV